MKSLALTLVAVIAIASTALAGGPVVAGNGYNRGFSFNYGVGGCGGSVVGAGTVGYGTGYANSYSYANNFAASAYIAVPVPTILATPYAPTIQTPLQAVPVPVPVPQAQVQAQAAPQVQAVQSYAAVYSAPLVTPFYAASFFPSYGFSTYFNHGHYHGHH